MLTVLIACRSAGPLLLLLLLLPRASSNHKPAPLGRGMIGCS